jgi:two-component system LytT family sensor kinase
MSKPEFISKNAELSGEAVASRGWVRWAVIFGACTLFIFINSTATYFGYKFGMFPNDWAFSWRRMLSEQVMVWYPVAFLTFPILWASRRFRLERQNWKRSVLVHLTLTFCFDAVVTFFSLSLLSLLEPLQRGGKSLPFFFLSRFVARLPISFINYWAILGAGYAIEYYRRFREQQLQASRLQAMLVEAQLQALKMQLHPHFLFNTLHAISALMDEDVKAARRMIARLSELLRLTLENAGQQEVPLRQELDALERYLEIEQIRFQDRLTVQMRIESETLEARVPNLILQPIVENSIRHGIAPTSDAGRIKIRAALQNGFLELSVQDDGPGIADGEINKDGIGLANTRSRLQQLYGDAHRLEIRNRAEGGLMVLMAIPFQKAISGG